MKHFYTLLLALVFSSLGFAQLNQGDIAFTAFNADGDDDFAIVALADIPANTIIYFTDNEPDTATTLTTGEGKLVWDTGASIITAGTIIIFSDTDSGGNAGFGASTGTLNVGIDTGMNLAAGGDALYAYHGTDEDTVTVWLAGIQNEANNEGAGFVNTGLTFGTTFINFYTSGNPDGGVYSGPRDSEAIFSDYLALLGDNSNWTVNTSDGEALLPYSTTAFTTSGGVNDTEVEFIGASASVSEGDGTFELEFTIINEDASNATTFDVVLTVGDAADINSYTTQTVTFPAGSFADQTLEITITDDAIFEADETLTFQIQNVMGGLNASASLNDSFDLTITNNDAPPTIGLPYSEDFSDCGTVQWNPFDQTGDDVWICAGGQYTMNGFGGTSDVDWLISNFSIDFDVLSNEIIAITTSEQFGDDINDLGEFEIRYSTDYAGFGDPTTATWTTLTYDPNNTSTGFGASADDTTTVDASGITGTAYLAFFYDDSAGSGPEEWNITDILIQDGALPTSVEFTSVSATVNENAVSYDLEFAITNEDASNATTFEVVLTVGDAADIDSYTTQVVNFAAGDATNQIVTITITDDAIEESDETFTFEIQNVTGGNAAAVGANSTFDLTIQDNDGAVPAEGDIVISEIMYNTPSFDDEWIEIYNASGSDITLNSSWQLSYGSDTFDFDGTVITAGDYVTIALGSNGDGTYNNDNPFTPDISTIGTPAASINDTNNLSNSTATIAIVFQPTGANITIDTVTYDDALPWDNDADGDGPSLELTDVSLDNALGENWTASDDYDGGTPGSEYVGPTTYTFNGTWSPSDPNGATFSIDNIVVESGDAVINADTNCNSVTVNPGAGLTVDAAITLAASGGVLLQSSSTNYSSLINNGTVSGPVTYERHVNINAGAGTTTGANDLIAAPLTGQSFDQFAAANPNIYANPSDPTQVLFGPFSKTLGTFQIYTTDETATLDPGVGYRAASNDNSAFTFTGSIENGIITNDIQNSGPNNEEWNLIGNPYPSYLSALDFLSEDVGGGEINITLFDPPTAAVWGYDGSFESWTIYNLATATPSTLIAPGQGFFVSADVTKTAGFDVEFTPDMRRTGSGDDFIPGRNAELIFLKLRLSAGTNTSRTDFYFNPNASLGFDVGYDAAHWGDALPDFALYSILVQDELAGDEIVLQALNSSDLSNVIIPLGMKASQGEQVTFSIAESTIPESVNVYLDDTLTNTSTLLNDSDYVITLNSDQNGIGRFFLRYEEDALSTIENNLDNIKIVSLKDTDELIVNGQLFVNTTLDLYDIQGRKVLSTKLDESLIQNRINVANFNTGVYIVTIKNNTQELTHKVMID